MYNTQVQDHPESDIKIYKCRSSYLVISSCYSSNQSDKNSTVNTHHRKLSNHELTKKGLAI